MAPFLAESGRGYSYILGVSKPQVTELGFRTPPMPPVGTV